MLYNSSEVAVNSSEVPRREVEGWRYKYHWALEILLMPCEMGKHLEVEIEMQKRERGNKVKWMQLGRREGSKPSVTLLLGLQALRSLSLKVQQSVVKVER